jgi:Zn-dependent metalloprotease
VSKKKYVSLQSTHTIAIKENEDKVKKAAALSDSLKTALAEKDVMIDSLSNRIVDLLAKKEKPKTLAYKKASSLTKEQEYDRKSQFVYNFAAYIEWPVLYNGTDFVIGVAGDLDVVKKIQSIMGSKKVGGKKVRIEPYDKVTKYQVVYVTSAKSSSFLTIRNDVKKNKTILVSDDEAFSSSGAHISFILDDDKVKYTVNKPSIEKIGLKVSQELMRFSE